MKSEAEIRLSCCNRCGLDLDETELACYREFKRCKDCWGKPSLMDDIKKVLGE